MAHHQLIPHQKCVSKAAKKGPSFRTVPLSVPQPPNFRMPKWWPEFAREACINVSRDTTFKSEEPGPSSSVSQSRDSTIFPSSDNNIPVSLMVSSTLPAPRADDLITQPIDNAIIASPARSSSENASISEVYAVESQNRLWEVEEILQRRSVRGRGLRAKRYLVQWTSSWLSAEQLHYARKTWKIVKTSQDKHAGKRGSLSRDMIRVQWAPSWVSGSDLAPRIEV